jgi:DNA-binding transcriptional LysR family regulator
MGHLGQFTTLTMCPLLLGKIKKLVIDKNGQCHMLSTDELVTVTAVADSGTFSAAAAHQGQIPSGVRRTISRLKSKLRVRLITRTTRRLDLTEKGRWLVAHARKILAELKVTEEELTRNVANPPGDTG